MSSQDVLQNLQAPHWFLLCSWRSGCRVWKQKDFKDCCFWADLNTLEHENSNLCVGGSVENGGLAAENGFLGFIRRGHPIPLQDSRVRGWGWRGKWEAGPFREISQCSPRESSSQVPPDGSFSCSRSSGGERDPWLGKVFFFKVLFFFLGCGWWHLVWDCRDLDRGAPVWVSGTVWGQWAHLQPTRPLLRKPLSFFTENTLYYRKTGAHSPTFWLILAI